MYNNSYSDCSQYMDSAEWLRLSDILNDWCKSDQTCRKIKELAILGACENGEVAYVRSDGKTFDDPVVELNGRGLLLINKRSFNHWKEKIDKPKRSIQPKTSNTKSLLDFVDSSNDEYISINKAIDAIHKHIGTHLDINKAVQTLSLAIGQAFEPPRIYKKDDFKGWIPVILKNQYNGDFLEASNPSDQSKLEIIHYLIKQVMDARKQKELSDELPF